MTLYRLGLLWPVISCLFAQDLMQEDIRKIASKKTSVYFTRGIFHSVRPKTKVQLLGIRHAYAPSQGRERIVFDFESSEVPGVYGHMADREQKLYLDFFGSTIKPGLKFLGESKYVKNLYFFPLGPESLSVEVTFRIGVEVEIFHLGAPGRVVVDVREIKGI